MGAPDEQMAWAFWIVIAVLLAVVIGAGFIPLFGGYSLWGWLRLLATTDWRH